MGTEGLQAQGENTENEPRIRTRGESCGCRLSLCRLVRRARTDAWWKLCRLRALGPGKPIGVAKSKMVSSAEEAGKTRWSDRGAESSADVGVKYICSGDWDSGSILCLGVVV
ncbi:hypothetical protein NDU88_006822 [Pleurodeles waltl]|uniref:Uncharacterized protein n=1 Tax=Pleurodeles waltl TaxID=8319 RepID=A0AAV7VS35_PLEWA|nr:hypothetical protein NDU88_006822 [Pleurodeles waltl]